MFATVAIASYLLLRETCRLSPHDDSATRDFALAVLRCAELRCAVLALAELRCAVPALAVLAVLLATRSNESWFTADFLGSNVRAAAGLERTTGISRKFANRPTGGPAEFHGGSSEFLTLVKKWHSSRQEFGGGIPAGWHSEESNATGWERGALGWERRKTGWKSARKRMKQERKS